MNSTSLYRHHGVGNGFPPNLSIDAIQRSKTPSKGKNIYNSAPSSPSSSWKDVGTGGFRTPPPRDASVRSSTPIVFSNSQGMLKPPPVEKKLECTLEELCYGCTKKINIIREVLTDTGFVFIIPLKSCATLNGFCFQ